MSLFSRAIAHHLKGLGGFKVNVTIHKQISDLLEEAGRRGDKNLQRALKEKVVKIHVSSAHVHSLVEVLKSPEVRRLFKKIV